MHQKCIILHTDGYDCSISSITSVISNKYFIHVGLCIGTRVDPVAMNFAVTGDVLSLRDLRLVASSLQASAVGQITLETCTGSLSDITIHDSTQASQALRKVLTLREQCS